MITGGKSGHLIEWNKMNQKTGRCLRIPEQNGACRVISHLVDNSYLIGTTKNCIFKADFDTDTLTFIINGHDSELWGLTANPRGAQFVTCGYDKNLMYWDSLSRTLVSSTQFDETLHCANLHPKHDLVAVGFASKPRWCIFDLNERREVCSQQIGTEQIECISFSPDGLYLACGSRDNFIYIYSVSEDGLKYAKLGKCSGHSSFITHLDWSVDSEYLMSNSGDYEILTWHASTCKQVTQVQQLRDLVFKTNTCVLSFNTIGIWNSTNDLLLGNITSYDGTDINACASSQSNKLCCCVDDLGKVNLFEYPCNVARAEKRVYGGHSSHVTNVVFINNDTRIITTGGNDTSILQWEILND